MSNLFAEFKTSTAIICQTLVVMMPIVAMGVLVSPLPPVPVVEVVPPIIVVPIVSVPIVVPAMSIPIVVASIATTVAIPVSISVPVTPVSTVSRPEQVEEERLGAALAHRVPAIGGMNG